MEKPTLLTQKQAEQLNIRTHVYSQFYVLPLGYYISYERDLGMKVTSAFSLLLSGIASFKNSQSKTKTIMHFENMKGEGFEADLCESFQI